MDGRAGHCGVSVKDWKADGRGQVGGIYCEFCTTTSPRAFAYACITISKSAQFLDLGSWKWM